MENTLSLYNDKYDPMSLRMALNAINDTNSQKSVTINENPGIIYISIIDSNYEFNAFESKTITLTGFKKQDLTEYQEDLTQKEIDMELEKRRLAALTPVKNREIIIYKAGEIEPESIFST